MTQTYKKAFYYLLLTTLIASVFTHTLWLPAILAVIIMFAYGSYIPPIIVALLLDLTFAYKADAYLLYGFVFTVLTIVTALSIWQLRKSLKF
jgi:hypothetical protein